MLRKRGSYVHLFLLLIVCAVFIWSVIRPNGYLIWTAEVLPAVVGISVAIVVYNKFRLTTLSYTIIAILSIIMFIGGHYTYAKVPLFNWIKEHFDLNRNNYDRMGHFLKGFASIIIREILIRKTLLIKGAWIVGITLSISLAIGALFEIVEWVFYLFTKGKKASEDYLGMQGDIWDAQWDMSLNLIGSIIALILLTKFHNKLLNK